MEHMQFAKFVAQFEWQNDSVQAAMDKKGNG
jgi:hypothetical protein